MNLRTCTSWRASFRTLRFEISDLLLNGLTRLEQRPDRSDHDLDQQRPARQQCPDRVTVEVLDPHLLEPTGLHDAGDAGRIVAVALIDLHLEHRLRMTRVDAD